VPFFLGHLCVFFIYVQIPSCGKKAPLSQTHSLPHYLRQHPSIAPAEIAGLINNTWSQIRSFLSFWLRKEKTLHQKFNSAPECICFPYPKYIFRNVKNIWPKFLYLHIHNLSRFEKISQTSILLVVYKKYKNCHVKYLIFSTKFCLFTYVTRHVARKLCEHVACEDVRTIFFNILKYIKYVFQNKGSICSQEPSWRIILG
jgi:hypothetical protein